MLVARLVLFISVEGCWFIEHFSIGGELGEAFFDCFGNLLNDIRRMVRFDLYLLDYVIWFLIGSVSAVVEIKSDILMLHFIITSKSLLLNTFSRRIFSICGPLQFLKNDDPSSFQLKFHSNIPDLQVTNILWNCSKKLMSKIVSKYNSNIKRILNDVIYYKNYLHTSYFEESRELLDHINIKQLKVFQFLSRKTFYKTFQICSR